MRRLWLIIPILISAVSAMAQETAEDYLLYKFEREPQHEFSVTTDTLLFYRALHRHSDLYDELSAYRFSSVEFGRRGYDFTSRRATLGGVELRYQNISLLRRLGVAEYGYGGLSGESADMASVVGEDCFSLAESTPVSGGNVALFLSGKGYLGGVRAAVHSLMRRGWSMSLAVAGKGGNDLYVKGVYNNSVDVGLRLKRDFDSGGSLSFVALSTVGRRGLRSGSTQEAFTLTGDRLYNPTWGRQDGKVRNSRNRSEAVPFVAVGYEMPIGGATHLSITLGGDYGHRGYTSLGWYDAMTPRPDNYRFLPSYFADDRVAEEVADEWRRGNERYTQVAWDDLYTQNRRSPDGAAYALEERVERIARGELALRMTTAIGSDFTLQYGARAWYNSSRRYKLMSDLLGAAYFKDIDYFLIDDDTYSNNLLNNLLVPNELVGVGDRFSYDYALVNRGATAYAGFEYQTSRWNVDASLAVEAQEIFRNGYFEKELFAGDKSLGRSAVSRFAPYTFKGFVGYSFSTRDHLNLAVMVSAQAPQGDDLYLNPMYNNRVVDDPVMRRDMAVELSYSRRSTVADVVLSAFWNSSLDGRQVMRAYDDLSTLYCDVDVTGIGITRYGVEAAMRLYLSQRWRAELTASAGEYKYSRNPLVSHYSDVDNSVVGHSSMSYMSDCRVGGAPHLTASCEATYFAPRGWILSAAANYAGLRWVDPSFIRRTERVALQGAASQEIYDEFISQQRLRDALTVDFSVSHWFRVGQSRMSLSLMVKNLLGSRDIVYGGYEQSRIRRYRSGAQMIYAPQDDIITYSYPRTFYGVVSWKF